MPATSFRFILVSTLVLLSQTAVSARGRAEKFGSADCLEIAEHKLHQGEQVRLLSVEHELTVGRYMGVNLDSEVMTMAYLDSAGIEEIDFGKDDIEWLRYRRTGKLRPMYPIAGFVIGSCAGLLLENEVIDPGYNYGFFEDDYFSRGSFWGGLAGLVAGSVLSLLIPGNYTITCE